MIGRFLLSCLHAAVAPPTDSRMKHVIQIPDLEGGRENKETRLVLLEFTWNRRLPAHTIHAYEMRSVASENLKFRPSSHLISLPLNKSPCSIICCRG